MDGQPFGFGLMQPGGSFGGPLAMQRARDPRYAYAQALMRGGADTSPVQTPVQGLARVGSGLVGAWMAREAGKDWDNRESNRAMAIANALKDASGTPAETKAYGDGTTINWNERKPDFQSAIAGLAQNPDTADMAMRMGMDERQYQRGRADQSADRAATQGFTREMAGVQHNYQVASMELQQAFQAAQQDKSLAAQSRLQNAQQAFTAAQNDAQRAFQGTENAANRQSQADLQTGAQNFQLNSGGKIAENAAGGALRAQNAPVTITRPQGPMQVPAGAAVGISKELSGGNLTTDQSNAATFADRMHNSNAVISGLEGINQGAGGAAGALVGATPGLGNALSSDQRQQFEQAKRDFVNSILRKESGAAIGREEFINAEKQYFPQPGDSPAVIEQKRANRDTALSGMRRAAGPSYKTPSAAPQAQSSAPNYSMDDLAAEMKRRGLPIR